MTGQDMELSMRNQGRNPWGLGSRHSKHEQTPLKRYFGLMHVQSLDGGILDVL